MNTASTAAAHRQPDRDDVVDYLLCALTALCGAGGYWILYTKVLPVVF